MTKFLPSPTIACPHNPLAAVRSQAAEAVRYRRRNGSYQSWRPDCSVASIHPKSKEFFVTLSSRTAASRSSAFVKNFGWLFFGPMTST